MLQVAALPEHDQSNITHPKSTLIYSIHQSFGGRIAAMNSSFSYSQVKTDRLNCRVEELFREGEMEWGSNVAQETSLSVGQSLCDKPQEFPLRNVLLQ